ncbi:MAG: GNAT family N-acetyltransferase [Sphingobacteriaceae bacterium]|nr:GNAT family N-acetyltransferase [Sphingobacteriaceae bacterium]
MIRPAKPTDATQVVPSLLQAMGELAYKLTHTQNEAAVNHIFEKLFRQAGNQYSYENTLVFEEAGKVLGALTAYDGARLVELRKPFLACLNRTDPEDNLDAETQSGEFYLDSISVSPAAQGKGIGQQLVKAGIARGQQQGHKIIGLLVEQHNERALKLYQRLGFAIQNEKEFMGGLYHHMVFKVK